MSATAEPTGIGAQPLQGCKIRLATISNNKPTPICDVPTAHVGGIAATLLHAAAVAYSQSGRPQLTDNKPVGDVASITFDSAGISSTALPDKVVLFFRLGDAEIGFTFDNTAAVEVGRALMAAGAAKSSKQ